MRILFTGGGSGGHIYPIVALARALREMSEKQGTLLTLMFVGSGDFDTRVLTQEGIGVYHIPAGKIRRYASLLLPWDSIKTMLGIVYAFFLLWWIMPDVVFAKGGYGSFAIAFVSRVYLIPLFVHESDSRPGLVNKILGAFATRVGVAFPETLSAFSAQKTALVGNPVRLSLIQGSREEALSLFQLQGDRPILFILGGSQGSTRINALIAESLHELLLHYEVIHQCGEKNTNDFIKELKDVYALDAAGLPLYHLRGFLSEREEAAAFAVADFVVSRAGAGSIYEIALAGKPSLLIPLPESSSGHQQANAFYYARLGGALVIEEENLTPHILQSEIANALGSPEKIAQMVKAAKEFVKPDAAKKIARELMEMGNS